MIKTALVGFGGAARNIHLPLLLHQHEMELVAVLSSKPEKVDNALAAPENGKPRVPCFTHYSDLLEKSDAELVVIATPNHMHYPMAMEALRAGKHVVVEKPVSTKPAEIRALKDVALQQNKHLFPFHIRRWDSDFLTVRELLASQCLGSVKLFESRFDRFRPEVSLKWKEQAGAQTGFWFDIGPHLLDQALQLFGTPLAVTARLLNTRENANTTDYFNVQLHYEEQEVILAASNHCAGPVRRFYMEGNNGSFNLMGLDPQEQQQSQGIVPGDANYGISADFPTGQLYHATGRQDVDRCHGNWPGFYQAVADCVLRGEPSPVNIDSAIEVAKFLQLALMSQEQNKTVYVRQYRD